MLKEFNGDWAKVARASHGIRELEVSIASHGDSKNTVYLGWDAAEVRRISKDIEAKAKAETEKRLQKEAADAHKKLVAEAKKIAKSETKSARNTDPLHQLSKCVGSYNVSCNSLESEYSLLRSRINIQESGPTKSILLAFSQTPISGFLRKRCCYFSEQDLDAYIAATTARDLFIKMRR